MMSTEVLDLAALLGDDPTFDENDEPLATQHHRDVIDSLYYSLHERLAGSACLVAAEVRIYRDPEAMRAGVYREPDVLVAFGRPDYARVVYLLSLEGKAPDFALEVLSESTHLKDTGEKRRWYRRHGVREYVVVDLEGEFAGEKRLQRWRLAEEGPTSTAPPDVALEGEVLASRVLPYGLVVREGWAYWVDRATGEELPLLREQLAQGRREAALRRAAQAQATEELERRLAAEVETAEELGRRLAAEARERAAEARERAAEAQASEELARRLAAEALQHKAEARTASETAGRLAAEARAAAEGAGRLAAEEEIARLRRALGRPAERDV